LAPAPSVPSVRKRSNGDWTRRAFAPYSGAGETDARIRGPSSMSTAHIIPASQGQGAHFEVEPIGSTIGAEIHGLDLARPLDDATFQAFEAALVEHKVIYARDQHLTTAQHVALGRRFGELEVHPFRPEGEFPEIMVLDNHKDNPVLSTDVWHSDTTFRKCP